MSTKEEKGFEKYQESHRDKAIDEIIDYESSLDAEESTHSVDSKTKDAAKDVAADGSAEAGAPGSVKQKKRKYNVVLSIQGLFLIYALIMEFVSMFQSVGSMSLSPYWIFVFIGQCALLIAIAVLLYFYFDGYKRSDNFFLIPIISYIVYQGTQIYTNAGSRIGTMYPWMNFVVALSIILCILSLIKINKFYFVVCCWIVILICALICSLTTAFTVTVPYIGENNLNIFYSIMYISMNLVAVIMSFGVLCAYIENTKRKATAVSGSKWVKRGDGKYWKFG